MTHSSSPTEQLELHFPQAIRKAPVFDGATYEPGRDGERLAAQMMRVYEVMSDHGWHTLPEISRRTGGDPEASISARLRDLRKARWGSHVIARRYLRRGLFEYRLARDDDPPEATAGLAHPPPEGAGPAPAGGAGRSLA